MNGLNTLAAITVMLTLTALGALVSAARHRDAVMASLSALLLIVAGCMAVAVWCTAYPV